MTIANKLGTLDDNFEDGKFTEYQLEPSSEQFEHGPNKGRLSLKTEQIKQSDELNEADSEIKKYFLFSKDPKENSVFLRNPETNIVWKIEQQINGKPSEVWLKSNLNIYVPNLLKFIQSKMEMGEPTFYTNDTGTRENVLNAKVLSEKIPEAIAFFPIIIRKEADRFGAYGRNYTTVENKVSFEVCEEATLTLSCGGKSIDIYQALVNNIFALKDDSNTVDTTNIKSYSLSTKDYSFHKLTALKVVHSDKCSFVTEWLRNRLTENEIDVLKAWIWGVFDAKNTGRQLLYLYDPEGHAGKSTFLQAVFKPLMEQDLVYSISKTDNSIGGRFDAYSYYDKRLLIWGDCKNRNFIKTSSIHALTGGDSIPVEGKGMRGFNYRPSIKLIIGSNTAPNIDLAARHETSRTIVLKWELNAKALDEMTYKDENGKVKRNPDGTPILHGDATIEPKLVAALPEFFGECEVAYQRLCKDRCTIDISNIIQNVFDVADDAESFYDDFFETYYERSDNFDDYVTIENIEEMWYAYLDGDRTKDNIRENRDISKKASDLLNHLTKKGFKKSKIDVNKKGEKRKQRTVLHYVKKITQSNTTSNDTASAQADEWYNGEE